MARRNEYPYKSSMAKARSRTQQRSDNNRKQHQANDPRLREARRAAVPEARRIVEEAAPRAWENASSRRIESVPEAWKALVSAMQAEVHAEAAKDDEDGRSIDERRGYYWSFRVGRVGDMLDYLMRAIRGDLGFGDGRGTLASMMLVQRSIARLDIELQDGGTREGRDDGEENRYRVYHALRALTPTLDDITLQRFRALQVAEFAAKWNQIPPTDEQVEASVADLRQEQLVRSETEAEHHRNFLKVDKPAVDAVFTRSLLAEIDARFDALDPLVVFEEFSEAERATGGKFEGGDGRIGPVRALARLAVMCGALDCCQEPGEDFDSAVSRARSNLLVTRSRIRKELRSFPGQVSDGIADAG